MVSALQDAGGEHVNMSVSSANPFKIFYNIFRILSLIGKYDIDLIHARTRSGAWSAYWAAKIKGIPFITTCYGAHEAYEPLKRWYNSIMKRGKTVIVASEYISKHLETRYRLSSDKAQIVRKGIYSDLFSSKSVDSSRVSMIKDKVGFKEYKDRTVILLVAPFVLQSGHFLLLKALKLIKDKNVVCIMAGSDVGLDYEYKRNIERHIDHARLHDRVKLCSTIDDMPALYKLADIVVVASTAPIASSRVILEAQSMGNIVIAPNFGGAVETIIDKESGFLIVSNNSSKLASVITKVIGLSDERKKDIAKNAVQYIKEHSDWSKITAEIMDIYNKTIFGS